MKIESENLLTGERKRTATAFLTFVALDEHGQPTPVPGIIPETEEEKKLFETAEARFTARKLRKDTRL